MDRLEEIDDSVPPLKKLLTIFYYLEVPAELGRIVYYLLNCMREGINAKGRFMVIRTGGLRCKTTGAVQ